MRHWLLLSSSEMLIALLLAIELIPISFTHRSNDYESNLLVTIKQGTLVGKTETSRHGRLYKAYYKVPYAKPPIGRLRFQPPQEAEKWQNVLYANVSTKKEDGCPQPGSSKGDMYGNEDCLILDIYAPINATKGDNIPVIFYVFGGGFYTGWSNMDGVNFLMHYNIIMVKPNYRLGVLGLLSTGDSIVPGNIGLKDQSFALKWTRDNILEFGGDPNQITLQGHSSGASSVGLHLYSPLSAGLFNRAIMMSGGPLMWDIIRDPKSSKKVAQEAAQILGCEKYGSSKQILNCLSKKNVTELVDLFFDSKYWEGNRYSGMMMPVVEDKNDGKSFLTDLPSHSKPQSSNVSWLIGVTSSEWAICAGNYLENDGRLIKKMTEIPFLYLPMAGLYSQRTKPNMINYVSQLLKTNYFGDESIGANTDIEITQMLSDMIVTYPVLKSVRDFDGEKYVYLYDYRSNFSFQLYSFGYNKYLGPSHVDDVELLFNHEETEGVLSDKDIMFGDELWLRYVNFAYSGNPNKPLPINQNLFGHWNRSVLPDVDYMHLYLGGTMQSGLKKDKYEFLRHLPSLWHN